jgi:hypothetical protein
LRSEGKLFSLERGSSLASLSQNAAAHMHWLLGQDPPTLARRVWECWRIWGLRGYDVLDK